MADNGDARRHHDQRHSEGRLLLNVVTGGETPFAGVSTLTVD